LEEMLDCQSMKNSFYNKKFYLARIWRCHKFNL
jgi:hypothetical protein